jgi:hypothetical protein
MPNAESGGTRFTGGICGWGAIVCTLVEEMILGGNGSKAFKGKVRKGRSAEDAKGVNLALSAVFEHSATLRRRRRLSS